MTGLFRQFADGFRVDLTNLSLSHPAVRQSLQASTATVLACFVAIVLDAQEPFWAGISAFLCIQATVGSTVYISILRICATVTGALLGLILASLLIDFQILYIFSVFLVALTGVYCASIFSRHAIIWFLGYLTVLLVMLAGLVDPVPGVFVELAFFRSFEFSIGIVVGLIVSNLFFAQYAGDQIATARQQAASALGSVNDLFFQSLTGSDEQGDQNEIRLTAKSLTNKLSNLDNLLDLSLQEARHRPKISGEYNRALSLRRLTEILFYCYRNNVVRMDKGWISEGNRRSLYEIYDAVKGILDIYQNAPDIAPNNKKIAGDITRLEEGINRLLNIRPKNNRDRSHHFQIIQCFRLFVIEARQGMSSSGKPGGRTAEGGEGGQFRQFFSGFYYDPYLFGTALAGSLAMTIVPFTWLYLGIPGYLQIVVFIALCVLGSAKIIRYSGYVLFMGCFAGTAVVLLILGLDVENLGLMLILLFLASFASGLIFFGQSDISRFGILAFVVIIMSLVKGLSPTVSIGSPLEWILGIPVGVLAIIQFQALIAPYDRRSHLQHLVNRSDKAFADVNSWIFGKSNKGLVRVDHWHDKRTFENCVDAIQEFDIVDEEGEENLTELQKEIAQNYRDLFHCLYAFILAHSDFYDEDNFRKDGDTILLTAEIIRFLPLRAEEHRERHLNAYLDELTTQIRLKLAALDADHKETFAELDRVFFQIALIRVVRHLYRARQLGRSLGSSDK
ncbi:MAG: FUSC family protein [Sneathiella sp.]